MSSTTAEFRSVSREEAMARLRLFDIGEEDEARIAIVRGVLTERAEEIVEQFYVHLLKFPECREVLGTRIDRLKSTQAAYLATLGDFRMSEPESVVKYVEHRLRVGVAHQRVGLRPYLYAGAYAKLGELADRILLERYPNRCDLFSALHRVLILDSHLALEAYQAERELVLTASAQKDALTQLEGRASLTSSLERELARAHRFDRPLSVLFLDIDQFKQVNDTLGHAAGDQLLKDVSRVLQDSVRPADVVGRYGGDEFVIVLVEADHTRAGEIADRMRGNVEAMQATATLSVGIATRVSGDTAATLIERADAAMYVAKGSGRNRVSFSSLRVAKVT